MLVTPTSVDLEYSVVASALPITSETVEVFTHTVTPVIVVKELDGVSDDVVVK